ncbi:unnamed protein product [Adineta ricciae]|uniref:Uncharacterized protein n=1 Tax=Adineta ricciae TaxID=249248 RepID=A0A814A368_ADIRI|nr:unnamed protein product [Adineta ricciae]
MSEDRVEAVPLSTSTNENCPASHLSASDDDVFYSAQESANCKVLTETNQQRSGDTSNRIMIHVHGQQQPSPSTDALDHRVDETQLTNISHDPYAQYIQRNNNNQITYEQNVFIRYLRPPTPPEPGPLIIREMYAPAPFEKAPLIVHQRSLPPKTPPPIVIRERPPIPPPVDPPRIVNRYLPAAPTPPRKIIIQRQLPLPPKPQPVIIEKWLPYKPPPQRRVIVQQAQMPTQQNPVRMSTIITHGTPCVNIVQNIRHLGTVRVDPHIYSAQYGSLLASSEYIRNIMSRFGIGYNYPQMIQMQTSAKRGHHFQPIDRYANIEFANTSSSSSSPDEDEAEFIDEDITPDEPTSSEQIQIPNQA